MRRLVPLAAGAFVLALAVRVLHVLATPDREWAHGAAYAGDSLRWLAAARALAGGPAFELGLPLRPPATGWLVALLWDGTAAGVAALRLAWAALGAAAVALFAWAAAERLGTERGAAAALWMAGSTALVVLAGSVDSETPYLLLVAVTLLAVERAARSPAALAALALAGALACLFRAEHGLVFAGLVAHGALVRGWGAARAAAAVAVFVAALAPWHLHAWSVVERFDADPRASDPAARAAAAVARGPGALPWDPEARAEVERFPAFARGTAAAFVAATVAHRGGTRVGAGDLAILDDAFGSRPAQLARRFFVCLSGPLNFALANAPGAGGGFSRAPLEEPPPLRPSPAAYPPALVAGLPPPDLTLVYPPHLALVREGYRRGLESIRADPAAAARNAAAKLAGFVSGAAQGFGGANRPLGASGVRRPADLAVPETSAASAIWTPLVLGLAAVGAWRGRRDRALDPWLVFAAAQAATAVAFFGYARLGATIVPVVALLAARALPERRLGRPAAVALAAGAALLLAGEAARFARPPTVTIDGRPIDAGDPAAGDEARPHLVEVR